jgi:hypothetical protein
MSRDKQKTHCYIDHANKKSEAFGATPYLFWLNQVRRQKEERQRAAERNGRGTVRGTKKSGSG